ncbi:MAG: HEAT repeat domain-containing protein, partial [Deltaproteobacteria bacterium]|nr:HEAT repeat domain-containing protein [Deltaproteobacteria bacterium]
PAAPADAPAPPEQASVAEAAAPTPERSAAPGPAAPAAGVAPAASAAEAAGGELRVSDPQPEPERAAEAAACPALRSPESGFRELFVALTSSIARVGYYAVGHPGYAGAARELSEAAARALRGRGELTFARRCGVDDVTLSVQSAAGTSEDLDKALVPSVFEAYGGQLSEVFVRRRLVSLTLKERIDEAQLRAVVELLSGPEITVEQMRQEFLARGLREVSVLFDEDLLGRGRGLPWLVDLCISRIARDLRALPILRGLDDAALRDLRKQLLVEVIRPLTNARQVQIMLDNADLINDAVRHHAGDAQVDMLPQLVDALAGPMCVLVTKLVLADIRGQAGPSGVPAQSSGAGEANRRLVELMVGRFARERSDKSDAVLRELRQAGLLRLEDLPEELQIRLLADDLADDLVADPKGVLAASLAMADDASRGRRHAILEHAVEVLAGHGEVVALGELVRYFQKLAEGGSETDGSRRLARRALDRLDSARTLRPTAEVALNGDRPAREAALHVLSASGPCAAQALCKVRAAGALEPAARARFVAVVRELGRPAVAALASELGRDDLAADDALAEDLLRAVPPVEDEGLAALVSPYLKHEKPALRRAALEALVSLRRAASRSELLDGLSDADDAVRSAAIRGLRQIRGIDGEAVAALLGLIAPERHGSLDLRIMAAAALGDADKPARAAALSALCRLLDPPKKSFVARLLDRRPEGEANPVLVETMCRALLRIGGERGAEAVRKRATAADPELRARLLGLIAG